MSERKYAIRIASGGRTIVAIDDFRIAGSAITVLLGESGIGKSLISLAVAGLLDPDDLDVQIDGKPYTAYLGSREALDIRRDGFFVFQEPSSHLNPLLTLRSQLREGSLKEMSEEGRILRKLWQGRPPSDIGDILDVYPKPYRPSGGEKQRILAAMAFKRMAAAPSSGQGSLFIFDEPTGNLDNQLRDELLDLLIDNFNDRKATVVLITHDYSIVSRIVKTYPAIAGRILYRELSLERGKLRLRDFVPGEYLSWLEKRKANPRATGKTESVVRLQPRVKVFGRRLFISRDQDGRKLEPLVVRKNAVTYLKAPSGAGKTTIVKLMMGLIKPEAMSMELAGICYSEKTPRSLWARGVWGRRMTMVFQHADEALNQNSQVKDVFSGLPVALSKSTSAIASVLSELFEEEMSRDFLRTKVKFLSGGQKQRLNLLRSFVLHTDILILDEPLNGLDFASAAKVIAKIEAKLKSGVGVLVISHNEEIFDTLAAPQDVYYLHSANVHKNSFKDLQ
jgi:peptide/nickel transport system ATP-binding protein